MPPSPHATTPPLVSVYMATKDRPDMLVRALASLYVQTWKPLQVLVCDDASQGNLDPVRKAFSELFDSFIWIRNERSMGAQISYNRLLELATGEYVTGMDDDDEFTPDRIETFVTHPRVDEFAFLCSRYQKCDGTVCRNDRLKAAVIRRRDMFDANIAGNHVFTRRERLLQVGGYDVKAPTKFDWDLWLRLLETFGDAYRIDAVTYRIYFEHARRKRMPSERSVNGMRYFLAKHAEELSPRNITNMRINDFIERKGALESTDVLNMVRYGCWVHGLRLARTLMSNRVV